jgi:hypothetical protein
MPALQVRALTSSGAVGPQEGGKGKTKTTKFTVDRSGLIGGGVESFYNASEMGAQSSDAEMDAETIAIKKEPMTPLARDLVSYIKLKGPITLHDYMAQSLNHVLHGYYQSSGEVIGEKGDFITAPEVSQLFGEMLGIWCLSMWMQMGSPPKINLIEMGPGKGSLMKDMLRVAVRFPNFYRALRVHMVELSATLRVTQHSLLVGGPITQCEKPPSPTNAASSSSSSDGAGNPAAAAANPVPVSPLILPPHLRKLAEEQKQQQQEREQKAGKKNDQNKSSKTNTNTAHTEKPYIEDAAIYTIPAQGNDASTEGEGVKIAWYSMLQQVPYDAPALMIGQFTPSLLLCFD